MGNLYTVIPLDDFDDETRTFLEDDGLEIPAGKGRWPTLHELRATLEGLDGYRVSYRDNTVGGWDAWIESPLGHATIWVKDAPADDRPHPFSFHKPTEEVALLILERLAQFCGPFVVVEASAGHAVAVMPGCDPVALADELWNRPRNGLPNRASP
jgi:hypothetical protein